MACGLPVAVSNRCGCARDVVTGDTGVTFDPASEDDALRAVRDLMSRPQAELERMGRAASLVARQYSPENSARLVIETVNSLLGGGAPGGAPGAVSAK
jgi:glycosyltransferase involved in cell wall biosynthesis